MVTGAGGASEGGYSADGGGGSYTRTVLEANENALNSDPATLLRQLAIETGGQSFNNTNNLKPAFERVDSDLRNYYMLGLYPAQHRVRRQVPNDPGKGEALRGHGGGTQGLLRGPRSRDVSSQRLGSTGARRPGTEAGAERVSRPRRRPALPRTRPSRSGAGGGRSQDGAADVPAGQGRQELHLGFHRAGAVPGWQEPGRPQAERTLRDSRRPRPDRSRQTGRGRVLPGVRAAGRPLLDGNGGARRAERQVQRALCHRRSGTDRG